MNPAPDNQPEALLAEASFVQRLARALVRDATLAEDVSQEVLTAALQQPEPPRNWRHWLSTVTRRQANKARAARVRRARHEANAAGPEHGDPEQHTHERLQLQRRLTDAVMALPEPYRTIVTMRFFDGLQPRAIAQRTHASSDVVRQRLRRGLVMLRERLDRDYGSRSAWLGEFASFGFLVTPPTLLTLSVLAMNKLALIAAGVIATCTIFVLSSGWGAAPAAPPVNDAESRGAQQQQASATSAEAPAADRTIAAATAPECTVTVRDTLGQATAEATVFCWQEDGAFVEGTTDERGQVRFAATGSGGLLAQHDGFAPTSRLLTERAGSHELRLAEGSTIAGMLWIDGEPAPPGRELPVRGQGTHAGEHVPESLQAHLEWRVPAPIVVGANGCFVAHGLPTNWRGNLRLPQDLWLLPESGGTPQSHDIVALDAPRTDLLIKTTGLPVVRGRVVWRDDGTPVANPFVNVYAKFADGVNSPMVGAQADADGNFVVGLPPSSHAVYLQWCEPDNRPEIELARISAHAQGSNGTTTVDFDSTQLRRGPVTVELPRAVMTHFRTLDRDGRPIAGAHVRAIVVSKPTDEDGRGTFTGEASDVRLIGAKGFRIGPLEARQPAAGTPEDPIVFVLAPDNQVTVHIVDDQDEPVSPRSLRLTADQALFAGTRYSGSLDSLINDSPISSQTRNNDGTDYAAGLTAEDDGKLVLHSLQPGIEAHLTARDRIGEDIATVSFVCPDFGEQHEVQLRLPGKARRIAGKVVDENGVGIDNATVRIGHTMVRVDADGSLLVSPVYRTEPIDLIIFSPGHVALRGRASVTVSDEQQVWTMQTARKVTVHVVDEAGEPVAVNLLAESPLAERLLAERQHLGDGISQFDNLPSGKVVFTCQIGGHGFRLEHDTAQAKATFRVPRPALLSLAASNGWPPTGDGVNLVAIVRPLAGEADALRMWRPEQARVRPQQLVAGRYRIELVEQRGYGKDAVDVPLGLSAEVTTAAGELTTATLR